MFVNKHIFYNEHYGANLFLSTDRSMKIVNEAAVTSMAVIGYNKFELFIVLQQF